MKGLNKISLGIVDDHPLFRAGVISNLEESGEVEVILSASNGIDMQRHIDQGILPDVILMDISMPLMNGFESVSWLRLHAPAVQVLALSMFEDDEAIIKMIRTGAKGYVLKDSSATELLAAIHEVHSKGFHLNDKVSGRLIHSLQQADSFESVAEKLSVKEIEFICLCCSELTYKQIAAQMNQSSHTIENYRESVFTKLKLKSRTGLVLFAIKNNLYTI